MQTAISRAFLLSSLHFSTLRPECCVPNDYDQGRTRNARNFRFGHRYITDNLFSSIYQLPIARLSLSLHSISGLSLFLIACSL
jgi:hypothetical protein